MPEARVNVTSPSPGRLEMHESMSDGGMSSRRQIETVPFEAGEPLMFEPGGKHLMLFSLDPTVKPGHTLALTFAFSRAQPVTVQAQVIAAGDPAPERHRQYNDGRELGVTYRPLTDAGIGNSYGRVREVPYG